MRRSLDAMFGGIMSETEWTLIKSEIDFLWPFKAAIDYLESDTKPTTPSVIPIFEKLHNVIKMG